MIDTTSFKQTLAHFTAGVTIITTLYENQPIGITATAFTSLSMEPPLILVNLSKGLFTHQAVSESGVFAVNLLSSTQKELGMRFAGMIPNVADRFAGVKTETAVTGCPLLKESLGWLDCRTWAAYDGGDHTIFVGKVVAAHAANDGTPLVYHNRQWQQTAALNE